MEGEPPPSLAVMTTTMTEHELPPHSSSSNELQQQEQSHLQTERISPLSIPNLQEAFANKKDSEASQNGNCDGDSDKRHSAHESEQPPSNDKCAKNLPSSESKETILLDEGVGVVCSVADKPRALATEHSSSSSPPTNIAVECPQQQQQNNNPTNNYSLTKLGISALSARESNGNTVQPLVMELPQLPTTRTGSQPTNLQKNETMTSITTPTTMNTPMNTTGGGIKSGTNLLEVGGGVKASRSSSHHSRELLKTGTSPSFLTTMHSSDSLNQHSNDEDSEDSDSSFRMVIDEENDREEEEDDEMDAPNTNTSTSTTNTTPSEGNNGSMSDPRPTIMSYPALATSNLQVPNQPVHHPQNYLYSNTASNSIKELKATQPKPQGGSIMTAIHNQPLPTLSSQPYPLTTPYTQKINSSLNSDISGVGSGSFILDTLIESSSFSNTILSLSNNNTTCTQQWFQPQQQRRVYCSSGSSAQAIENDLTMPGQVSYSIMHTPTTTASGGNSCFFNQASCSSQPSQNITWHSPSYKCSGFLDENVLSTTRLIQQQQQQQHQQLLQQHQPTSSCSKNQEALKELTPQTTSASSTNNEQPQPQASSSSQVSTESSTTSSTGSCSGASQVIPLPTISKDPSNHIITDSYSLDGASSNFQPPPNSSLRGMMNQQQQQPQKPFLLSGQPDSTTSQLQQQPLISHISLNTNAVYQQAMHYNSLLVGGNTCSTQQPQPGVVQPQSTFYSSQQKLENTTSFPTSAGGSSLGFINACYTPTSSCPSKTIGTPSTVWAPQPNLMSTTTTRSHQQTSFIPLHSVQNVKPSSNGRTNVNPSIATPHVNTSISYSTTSSATESSSSSSVSSMNIDELVKGKRSTRRISKNTTSSMSSHRHTSPSSAGVKKNQNQMMTFHQRELKQEQDKKTREHLLATHFVKENQATTSQQPFPSSFKFVNQYEEMNVQVKGRGGKKNSSRPSNHLPAANTPTMPNWIQKTSSLRGKSKKAVKEQPQRQAEEVNTTKVASERPASPLQNQLVKEKESDTTSRCEEPHQKAFVGDSPSSSTTVSSPPLPQPIKQKLKMKYKAHQ